jgi:hypothetical protein
MPSLAPARRLGFSGPPETNCGRWAEPTNRDFVSRHAEPDVSLLIAAEERDAFVCWFFVLHIKLLEEGGEKVCRPVLFRRF